MNTDYSDKIRNIAINTFEITCYMFPIEEWEVEDYTDLDQPDGSVRSIVSFDGAAVGGMVITPSAELLSAMAINMLGVEEADEELKQGALCEIANIICGNTVPLFAKNNNICYIRPPRIAEEHEDTDRTFEGMHKESLSVFLDEGIAEILIYYSEEVKV